MWLNGMFFAQCFQPQTNMTGSNELSTVPFHWDWTTRSLNKKERSSSPFYWWHTGREKIVTIEWRCWKIKCKYYEPENIDRPLTEKSLPLNCLLKLIKNFKIRLMVIRNMKSSPHCNSFIIKQYSIINLSLFQIWNCSML